MVAIDPAFFTAFPNLRSVDVSDDNERFSSYGGMLFNKELTNLLLVPEGMEGSAVLPETLATVPACVFSRCTKLSAIVVNDALGSTGAFSSWNGILYNADKTDLLAAPAGLGASATIAPECATIADGAFLGNEGLQTIIADGAVAEIADGAFESSAVEAATVLTSERAAWEAVGFTHFAEAPQPGDAVAPAEGESGLAFTLMENGQLAVAWTGDEAAPAQLEIPASAELDGVTYTVSAIAEDGFSGQTSIEEAILPETLTALGAGAFEDCANLRTLSIPGSVADIPARAFAGCANLQQVSIAEGVRTIGENAFQGVSAAELQVPSTVSSIQTAAFADMPQLHTIIAAGDVAEVDPTALSGNSGINIYVPARADEGYSWPVGLAATGNHVLPYGVQCAQDVIRLGLGETADVFNVGGLQAPEGIDVSYSYNAKVLSIDPQTSTATAKGYGRATVTVRLAYGDKALATATVDVVVENSEQGDGSSSEETAAEGDDANDEDGTVVASNEDESSFGEAISKDEADEITDNEAGQDTGLEKAITSNDIQPSLGNRLADTFSVLGVQNIYASESLTLEPRAGMTFAISAHAAGDAKSVIKSCTTSISTYSGPLPSAGSFTASATLQTGISSSKYSFEWSGSAAGTDITDFITGKDTLNAKVNLPAGFAGDISLTLTVTSLYSSITTGPNVGYGITAASVSPTEYKHNANGTTTVTLSATQSSGDQGTVGWICSPANAATISGNKATIKAGTTGNITFTPSKLYIVSATASTGAATATVSEAVYPHVPVALGTGAINATLSATPAAGYKGSPTWTCNDSRVSISSNVATIPLGMNKNLTFTATYNTKNTYTLTSSDGTGSTEASAKIGSSSSYQISAGNQTVTLSSSPADGYAGYANWTCNVTDTSKVQISGNGTADAKATIKAGCTGDLTFTATYNTYAIATQCVNAHPRDTNVKLTSTSKAEYSRANNDQRVTLTAQPMSGYTGYPLWSCTFTESGRDAIADGSVVIRDNGAPHVSAYIASGTTGGLTFTATYSEQRSYSISFAENSTLGEHSTYSIGGGESGFTVEDTWFEFTVSPAPGYTGTPTISLSPSSLTAQSKGSGTYYVALDQCTQDITVTVSYTQKLTYRVSTINGDGANNTTATVGSAGKTYQISDTDQTVTLRTERMAGYVGSPTWSCNSNNVTIRDVDREYTSATIPAGTTGDLVFRAEYSAQGAILSVPSVFFEPTDSLGGFSWNNRVNIRGYEDPYEQSGYSDLGDIEIEDLGDGIYRATINSYGSAVDDDEPSMLETDPVVPEGYTGAVWVMDSGYADAPQFRNLSSSGGGKISFEFKAEDYYSGADQWHKILAGEQSVPKEGLGFSVRLQFTPNKYNITVKNGGGAATWSALPSEYSYNPDGTATIQLRSTPATGYSGSPTWTSSNTSIATVSGTTATIKAKAMGPVTFTVSYEPARYTITPKNGTGSAGASVDPRTYTYNASGETRVSLSSRAIPGYKGNATWSVSGNSGTVRIEGNGTANAVAVIAARTTGNLTFTADYSPIEYSITFNVNDAMGGYPPRSIDAVYGREFTIDFNGSTEPYKYGYEFDGWALAPDGEKVCEKYSGSDLTTEDGKIVTLYAHFSPLSSTVKWSDPAGIITAEPVSSEVVFTVDQQIPDISSIYTEPAEKQVGYRFDGWWYDARQYYNAQGGRAYTDVWPARASTPSSITLVGLWQPVAFTMQYVTDAPGMGLPYNDKFTYKGDGRLAECTFTTDAAHQFDGWLITYNGISKKHPAGTPVDSIIEAMDIADGATVTAAAQWTEKEVTQATISWNDGSGADPIVTVLAMGEIIVPPASPVKDEYVFMGWGAAGSSTPIEFGSLQATADTTYYAIWDQPWFTISFRGDGTRYAAQPKQVDWVDDAGSIKIADRYANKVFGVNGDEGTVHMWVKYGEADSFSLPAVASLFELAGATPDPQWLMGTTPLNGGAVIGSGQAGAPSFEALYGGTEFRGTTGAQLKACFNPALSLTVPVRADIQLNADDAADAQNNGCDLSFVSGSIAPIGITALEERSSAADKAQFDARMKEVLSEPDFASAYLQIADTTDSAKGYKLMLSNRTGTLLNEAKPLVLDAGVGETLTARYSLKGYDPAHLSVSTNMKVANLAFTYQIQG